ncbi:MAG: c-type cytochrome domain-containing protein [Bacteroidota bacterium]
MFPESNVSFSRHVEAVFRARCIACHSGSTAPEGLDLSTPAYSNLMNHIPRLVIAGDPDNSLLVWRIEGQGGLARMPFGQPPLTQNQITGIRTWISEGGVNN